VLGQRVLQNFQHGNLLFGGHYSGYCMTTAVMQYPPCGDRFDSEVLGLYRVRNGKLLQAKMFYFDTAAVAAFLKKANADRSRQ
jgi:hypothetical protein